MGRIHEKGNEGEQRGGAPSRYEPEGLAGEEETEEHGQHRDQPLDDVGSVDVVPGKEADGVHERQEWWSVFELVVVGTAIDENHCMLQVDCLVPEMGVRQRNNAEE